MEYIELFNSRSFDLPEVVEAIGAERLRLPVVLVNDQVVSDGAKLNEGLVASGPIHTNFTHSSYSMPTQPALE